MSQNTDSKIAARVEEFVQELTILIHEAALEAVQNAIAGAGFGFAGSQAKRASKKSGPKPGPKPAGAARPVGRPAGKKAAKKGGRIRRTSQDLGDMRNSVVAALKAEPGQSISQIADVVGVDKKDLLGPIAQLLSERKVRKTGERRGTKYFSK